MTNSEKKLVAHLLDMAGDIYSNHGCNDFDLADEIPDKNERDQLVKEVADWSGDPDFYREGNMGIHDYRVQDWMLFHFFADKVVA